MQIDEANVLISAAYDAGPDYVHNLLRSFRKVNSRDHIILLVTERSRLKTIAKDYNVELHVPSSIAVRCVPIMRVPFAKNRIRVLELVSRSSRIGTKLSSKLPNQLIQAFLPFPIARLFHSKGILNSRNYRHILLSDARDVLFQSNPFDMPTDLEFAAEDSQFGTNSFNDNWMQLSYGESVFEALRGKTIFCSGTIFGSQSRIKQHLELMCANVRRLGRWKCGGQDQAVHNFIIHNVLKPENYIVSNNRRGRIATLGSGRLPSIEAGQVIDDDNRPFSIVHQYDRLSPLQRSNLTALRV